MLNIAFKEWASICRALAMGRQSIILRKGGIAETGGEFRPEHARFWLYPTFVHQQESGLKSDAAGIHAVTLAWQPPAGTVRIQHFCEVGPIRFVDDLPTVLELDPLHIWSEGTVVQRFHYRKPGLFVLPVRVFARESPIEFAETPQYAGCKTWVELDTAIPATPAVPVLNEERYAEVLSQIDQILTRT